MSKIIMDEDKIIRTIKRLAHEVIEQNSDLTKVVLLGIKHKGVPFAKLLQENIEKFEDVRVELDELDITNYRDDKGTVEITNDSFTYNIPLEDKIVILVDDVLYTGRSVRAAMDAIMDRGRAKKIQLAVLIDRGHRELPISPNYVGKNIPTSKDESVVVTFDSPMTVVIK